jgi:fructosamine-3-kinase
VVFKPACYYGDPLVDLARAKLAGHLPDSFYSAYWQHMPHHAEESLRLEVYQLYFLLHQFNHIGGVYTQPITHLAQHILLQIGS